MNAAYAALITIFHLKWRVKRKKLLVIPSPPREWKKQPLNKLKLYENYINKKAEIAPVR